MLLQILHRLPHVEPLRPHTGNLINLLLKLLRTENEDNAVLVMKIIIDLHRTYSRSPPAGANPGTDRSPPDGGAPASPVESSVHEFLQVVGDLFRGMDQVVNDTFAASPSATGAAEVGSPAGSAAAPPIEGDTAAPVMLAPAMKSFKLLQDCPAAIVFIFQTYRSLVDQAIHTFVPLVFTFLELQAGPQARKHQSMEPGKSWVGVAPEIPRNKRAAFQEFILAQTKTMSFLAYILRVNSEALKDYLTVLPTIAVRLMKDCPGEAVAMKRDLLVATRHILQSELRSSFLSQIDTLLDDHVLIGNGVTAHENLRPLAYSMLADLIHHVRSELTLAQLARIVHIYSANVHDPSLAAAIQTMCSKLLLNLIDPIASKQAAEAEPDESVQVLHRMQTVFVAKMEAMAEVRDEWPKWSKPRESLSSLLKKINQQEQDKLDKGKGKETDDDPSKEDDVEMADADDKKAVAAPAATPAAAIEAPSLQLDEVDIERAKPMRKAMVMVDPGPDPVKDARFLFRNVLFGFKTICSALTRMRVAGPDTETMCRFFDAGVKCMVLFDPTRDQGREQKEVMEVFSTTLVSMDLLVFQEVTAQRMDFFFKELVRNHELLIIPQSLLSNESVSTPFVRILFKFLIDRLPDMAKLDKDSTTVMLRLYKMSFMAITIFPEKNEPVLHPHLNNLIMDSLKLAGQAADPSSYYLLLRALFRSIGGGRFENLYLEVLPLLQLILERLNFLLKTADKSKRDIFAELLLTVPVRLSVLLPYLSYLLRPLVHSLGAGPELVTQGLRTLELCIDNLASEFMNPLIAPVIDEVMVGLHRLLRPLPFNHQHAHTTMRILGKIGGRNRREVHPPRLEWKPAGPEALFEAKFEGKEAKLRIGPVVEVALKVLRRGEVHYRRPAFNFLKYAVALFIKDGLQPGEPENTFGNVLRGLFAASRIDEFTAEVNEFIFHLANHIFSLELNKEVPEGTSPAAAKQVLPICLALIDGVIDNLCSVDSLELDAAADQTQRIVEDLIATRANPPSPGARPDAGTTLLHQMGSRLCSLCYEEAWQRKTGAARGLSILASKVELEIRFLLDHEIEFTRALLFALKDMPGEAPINSDQVADTLLHIVKACSAPGARDDSPQAKNQLNYLVGLLLLELCSQVASVRTVVKQALKILSDSTGTPLTEMLMPVRDRLITPIFTKPLRALGFTMQIGHIDAVTYCISLQPPLIDFDDQLSRLLHEALGIADADDSALMGTKTLNKITAAPLTQLRVVCIELLTAAMNAPDFVGQRHQATRIKAMSVCFKLLYSKAAPVVEAASASLRDGVIAGGKLPKDLLQSGLKPVLMNLSDHKKLSVSSLKGLARLLELLVNYFKVEIGHKLLDHFRNLAVPGDIVRAATRGPIEDNEIDVMAAVTNIFHLLPHPGSLIFLEDLIKLVVEVERHLKKLKMTPFTEPLTKYLKHYPDEAISYLFGRLSDDRLVLTFRGVLASEFAEELRQRISNQAAKLFEPMVEDKGEVAAHSALLIKELIIADKTWITRAPEVVALLIQRWVSDVRRSRLMAEGEAHFQQLREDALILDIFIAYLEQREHVDLLFHIVDVFTYWNSANHSALCRFLNTHVALSTNLELKKAVLTRFIDIFENEAVTKAHKTSALRMLINPILLVSFSRGEAEADLVDVEWLNKVHKKIWQPLLNAPIPAGSFEDEALRVELLQMSTLVIRACSGKIHENKKDVIKFGWVNIRPDDITVKQAAYLLIATFLERYESPAKIVLQIYNALLKAHQPEARQLVREALDVLGPALPKRIPPGPSGVPAPSWALLTRKALVEDSSSTPLLVNIYQLIVRQHELFYPYRDMFVPHMVASLTKLTHGPSVTPDTRILTLDVIELILKWERKRCELAKQDEGKMELDEEAARSPKRVKTDRAGSAAASAASAGSGPGAAYPVPAQLRDQVINNLLRFIANSPETVSRSALVARALGLFKELIGAGVWSDFNVKLSFFQRTFTQSEVTEESLVLLCNSADVLNVVASSKPAEWFTNNIATLHMIIEKGFSSQEFRLHQALRPLVERIAEVLPANVSTESTDVSAEVKAFVEWVTNTVNEGLRAVTNVPAMMIILQAWAKANPHRIDAFHAPLIRIFNRYTKDHVTSPTPVSSTDPHLRLLVSTLEVLRSRVAYLGDQRRWFLSAIVQLVEKSSNVDVCRFLLQMTRKWVTDTESKDDDAPAMPTAKEKAGILLKMMSFETRNSELLNRDYLTLILDIYQDPALARTELTMRLEPAFLLGCKVRDPALRSQFLACFDKSLATGLFSRLHYVIGVQSWESLGETYWIQQALDLVLGAADGQDLIYTDLAKPYQAQPSEFVTQLEAYTAGDLLGAARKLLYADSAATQQVWVSAFTATWACLTRREQLDLTKFLVALLTKEYHLKTVDRRPNVIQTLLAGVLAASPSPSLPPHVIRYLGKTFNAWHTAAELLQNALENPREEEAIRETTLDALAETYSELNEEDLLYGLWRRRAGYNETNAAISWEQIGQWGQAQVLYESAQITARSGVLPFSESEMALWEDHWIITAQKLQQWDILTDLAKNEGNKELLLECAWRLNDWVNDREMIEGALESMSPVATPRRRVFESFLALLKLQTTCKDSAEEAAAKKGLHKLLDEGVQLSLRKWFYLPEIVSAAHVPLLTVFQQFVELQETQQIFASLQATTSANLDARSAELKGVLAGWRERLPNLWDDINVWSDLVAWRQHVFGAINKTYLPLVPAPGQPGASQNSSSFAYRGYHETAWIINRFAHVARKHHLSEVCISSLTKIYTLPNIEIQEAFLKLREQAKCHYQNPSELSNGLEVINNTNLMYFNAGQKAEFFTLKGMFLAKLHLHDDANQTFNMAVSMDMAFPKAWAEWGEYHDCMFKENPQDLNTAANAVSCYLQAAGLYKSAKVRKLLVRILWLLSLDDSSGAVAKAFDSYKGEVPTWYWITFIPQLLLSLSQREARYARIILMKIAKTFPQSLFFQLRTVREDLAMNKRQHVAATQRTYQQQKAQEHQAAVAAAAAAGEDPPAPAPASGPEVAAALQQLGQHPHAANGARHPWEHVEEIMSILKTAFPLLALSMEMIVDQVSTRFKPTPDEDIYRLISALLADSLQQYVGRATQTADDGMLSPATVANVGRFAENLHPAPVKAQFEKDFLSSSPTLKEYVQRLQTWRDRYEALLNKKAKTSNLEAVSHWLVEFQYQKFDEIEVPGQYLKHEDNNVSFIRISHFANKFEVTRSHGVYFRRLTIIGHDGGVSRFAIQVPSVRTSRREERIMQLFRMLNCSLETRKEARKRSLFFNIPIVVPLSPGVRLVENDSSVTSLQDIFEQHCDRVGLKKEDPILAHTERIRGLHRMDPPLGRPELWNGRQEIAEEIAAKMVPDSILKEYMVATMASPSELWHVRRQMTLQLASFIFMTYVMSMGARVPSRIHISRSSGKLATSDMLPSIVPNKPEFVNTEAVPFRFTPNLQRFVTPIGTEGLLTSSLMAIGRSLTESEFDLEHRLSIFIREEVVAWAQMSKQASLGPANIRDLVLSNVDSVVRRARVVSCKMEREKQPSASVPVNQSILELLLQATSAQNLSRMDSTFAPWL